jgi:deoxyribonuclease IV
MGYFRRMIVGAHVSPQNPLREASDLEADCAQIFLGNPQSWKKPPPRGDSEELKASKLPIYVHAPYLINVASPNNRVRIPSRKILAGTMERAAEIGAAAVIVHGGHAEDGVEAGLPRWRKAVEEMESDVRLLIENTAGGENAMTRYVENIARLWDHISDLDVGFCFDTCHAHAAGEELSDVVARVLDLVGTIDLVHANDSRDPPGTGADRHANFADGQIADEDILAMVKATGAPAVICETPRDKIAEDVAWLKRSL